jgi:hypothetical protein
MSQTLDLAANRAAAVSLLPPATQSCHSLRLVILPRLVSEQYRDTADAVAQKRIEKKKHALLQTKSPNLSGRVHQRSILYQKIRVATMKSRRHDSPASIFLSPFSSSVHDERNPQPFLQAIKLASSGTFPLVVPLQSSNRIVS